MGRLRRNTKISCITKVFVIPSTFWEHIKPFINEAKRFMSDYNVNELHDMEHLLYILNLLKSPMETS